MVQASEAFKQAVRDGEFQRAVLRFPDLVLTNEDISITSGGIRFYESLNDSEELTIGNAPSSTLTAYINNPDELLSTYAFGEFEASIGAQVDLKEYEIDGDVTAVLGDKTFTGHDREPYLTENGAACSVQPGFAVKSIVADGNTVWLFGENRSVYAFTAGSENVALDNPSASIQNEMMWRKADRLVQERRGIALSGLTETEWMPTGLVRTVEFVKLGTFIAERPSVLIRDIVELEANDRMSLFDDIWMRDISVGYPTTLGALLKTICAKGNVPLLTESFINSGLTVGSAPDSFENATAHEVIGWIAEAACSYARFNRDGQMELVWFRPMQTVFDEHDYSDFTPYSYSVQPVTQLYVRNSDSTVETKVGSGDNVYLIQDNPFLRKDDGSEAAAISLMAAEPRAAEPSDEIYARLSGFESFSPSSADLFTDWSMQAGDVVTVRRGDDSYSLPVYTMDMSWTGAPKIIASSSGSEKRDPPSRETRERYQSGRNDYEASRGIAGLGGRASALEDRMSWAEINIDENEAFIQLTAGRVDEAEGRISQAEIDIDGANAAITLQAGRIDKAEGRISSAEIAIDGANAAIALKVDKDGVIGAINVSPEEIRISAARVVLDGYVTASQFSAEIANINKFFSGESHFSQLNVSGAANIGSLTIGQRSVKSKQIDIVTGISTKTGSAKGYGLGATAGNLGSLVTLNYVTSVTPSKETIYYWSWE